MSYEIIHPKPVGRKPMDAVKILRFLEERGFKPYAVSVDNDRGVVKAFFREELEDKEEKRLYEELNDYLRGE
jgi:hypothetical protein